HQPAAVQHGDRARHVPRLRVLRIDRLDRSESGHGAMLLGQGKRSRKGPPGRERTKQRRRTTGSWTAAQRPGRSDWLKLLFATGGHARAAAGSATFVFALLGHAAPATAPQPLPLLDQLSHLLAALVADLRVELGAAARAHALSALLPDLLVELVPALCFDGLAALLADLL